MGNKHRKHSIFTIHRKLKLGGVIVKLQTTASAVKALPSWK